MKADMFRQKQRHRPEAEHHGYLAADDHKYNENTSE